MKWRARKNEKHVSRLLELSAGFTRPEVEKILKNAGKAAAIAIDIPTLGGSLIDGMMEAVDEKNQEEGARMMEEAFAQVLQLSSIATSVLPGVASLTSDTLKVASKCLENGLEISDRYREILKKWERSPVIR